MPSETPIPTLEERIAVLEAHEKSLEARLAEYVTAKREPSQLDGIIASVAPYIPGWRHAITAILAAGVTWATTYATRPTPAPAPTPVVMPKVTE